ncbi:MAG: hypothetical protein ACMUJM_18245 [bacterium]
MMAKGFHRVSISFLTIIIMGIVIVGDMYVLMAAKRAYTDQEAMLLALEISGSLVAPQSLYETISDDLSKIRASYPSMASIHYHPPWVPGELLIGLTSEAMKLFEKDKYRGLTALNRQFKPVEIISHTYFLELKFDEKYNPEYLAPLYAAVDGVKYAEPNWVSRHGDMIEYSSPHYIFSTGWGDCPSGCISHHHWVFSVIDESVTLVNEYGSSQEPPVLPTVIDDYEDAPITNPSSREPDDSQKSAISYSLPAHESDTTPPQQETMNSAPPLPPLTAIEAKSSAETMPVVNNFLSSPQKAVPMWSPITPYLPSASQSFIYPVPHISHTYTALQNQPVMTHLIFNSSSLVSPQSQSWPQSTPPYTSFSVPSYPLYDFYF